MGAAMGSQEGGATAIRSTLMPKVWFFSYNLGAVFFIPYINLFYRSLGFSEQQIGILAALKPFVAAPAGQLIVSAADSWRAHFPVALATYLVALLGRGLIILASTYGVQVFLALLTEAAAAPLGVIIDAAVMAAAKAEGGYGRSRMWASVGWGGMSPLAGAAVARCGLKFAFAVYFVVCSFVFVPTCLLPISALSAKKTSGDGGSSKDGGGGGGSGGEGPGLGGGEASEAKLARDSSTATSGTRDSESCEIEVQAGSKQNLLAAVGLEHQWSIPSAKKQHSAAAPGAAAKGSEPLSYGVLHLTADARTPTEQLAEMVDGGQPWGDELGCGGKAARPAASSRSGAGGGAGSPLLRQVKQALVLADDADSGRKAALAGGAGVAAGEGSQPQQGSVLAGVARLMRDVKVVTFFFLAFLMGIANGSIGYLFLYLDELGATGTLMGLCLSFNCAAEVPVFYFSGPIIERLGVERAFNLAMAGYLLRLGCYIALPLLPSVWWVLPVELLQGLTFALAWSAGCVYVKRISPVWLRSTVQSCFQGLYAGLGAGLGGLMGGFVYGLCGADVVFKAAAAILLVGMGAAMLTARVAASKEGARYQGYA